MASLSRGDLSRIAREHNLRLADFYDARDGSARGVKTAARAQKIAAATGGAVSAASILGLDQPSDDASAPPLSTAKGAA